jgi:hypothetical protein
MGLAATCIRRELIDLARHYFGPEGMGTHRKADGPVAHGWESAGSEAGLVNEAAAPACPRSRSAVDGCRLASC